MAIGNNIPIDLVGLTPVTANGRAVELPPYGQTVPWDSSSFPTLLYRNGLDPTVFRSAMTKALIGDPFEMEQGEEVPLYPPSDYGSKSFAQNVSA